MQDNNIMIRYKIQDVKIIKIIDGEYHIYGIRNNKKHGAIAPCFLNILYYY